VQLFEGVCPANSYCPGGVASAAVACPANTVSLPYSTKPSDCSTALGRLPWAPTLSDLPSRRCPRASPPLRALDARAPCPGPRALS
jgi:hypothetical protein